MIIPIRQGDDLPLLVIQRLGDPALGALTASIMQIARFLQHSKGPMTKKVYRDAAPWLCYTLHETKKGLLPLNRGYKPAGVITKDHVEYDAKAFDWLRVDPDAVDLSHLTEVDNRLGHGWFLFPDAHPPWGKRRSYLTEYWDALVLTCRMTEPKLEIVR